MSPNLKAGISDRFFGYHLVTAADLDVPVATGGSIAPHLGLEWWPDYSWALRAGYDGVENSPTAGATWIYQFYEFDYAYIYNAGGLGDRHQISMLLKF